MNVLLLSTSLEGGAGGAALRLHQGLLRGGANSQILVDKKSDDDHTVIPLAETRFARGIGKMGPKLNALPLLLYPNRTSLFYTQWSPGLVPSKVKQLQPDVINLHWVLNGYVQIDSLRKLNRPLVWTLHDMWPFTGGCVHSLECDRYKDSCGMCPQLQSDQDKDLSRWVWSRKSKAWKGIDLAAVTPSSWLAECARSSSLFRGRRVQVIPNGLDTNLFKPIDKRLARQTLNLPTDKKIILFGAWMLSYWKGFHLLQAALQRLAGSESGRDLEVALFGFSRPKEPVDLGIKSHYLGRFHDALSLAVVYSAADLMIVPSVVENFPSTACESFACGTPVVGFNATGLKEIVDHRLNGYLAEPFEAEDLAKGIVWSLENQERHRLLCQRAREKAEQQFTLDLQASRYMTLFSEMIESYERSHQADH